MASRLMARGSPRAWAWMARTASSLKRVSVRPARARGSQPYLGPRGLGCPGDMMIDWVSPPAGMRPLSLIRPSAWPSGKGRQRLTADGRERAAVVPIGEFGRGGPGRAGGHVLVTMARV